MQTAKYQKEKIILTDIDGCVLDWNLSFHDWMKSKNVNRLNNTSAMIEDQYDLPVSEVRSLIREFNNSDNISKLPSFLDAEIYLKKLYNLNYRFICITSIGNTETIKENRIKNLKNLFGNTMFLEFVFLKTYESKETVLLEYCNKGLYWIEDSRSQYEIGRNLGLVSFHLDVLQKNNDSVSSWEEIYKKIIGDR